MNELTFGDLVDDLDGVTQEVSTDFAVTDLALRMLYGLGCFESAVLTESQEGKE